MDLQFVEELLQLAETRNTPLPCPIEQRWSCGSEAPMSPAASTSTIASGNNRSGSDGGPAGNQLYSWVGIIMYLPPSQTAEQRRRIHAEFRDFVDAMAPLLERYNAHCHWGMSIFS